MNTVTSIRSGEVYEVVEDRGASLILRASDGSCHEARAKHYTTGGEFREEQTLTAAKLWRLRREAEERVIAERDRDWTPPPPSWMNKY